MPSPNGDNNYLRRKKNKRVHNEMERNRRGNIGRKFKLLSEVLPFKTKKKPCHTKILRVTIDHLKNLENAIKDTKVLLFLLLKVYRLEKCRAENRPAIIDPKVAKMIEEATNTPVPKIETTLHPADSPQSCQDSLSPQKSPSNSSISDLDFSGGKLIGSSQVVPTSVTSNGSKSNVLPMLSSPVKNDIDTLTPPEPQVEQAQIYRSCNYSVSTNGPENQVNLPEAILIDSLFFNPNYDGILYNDGSGNLRMGTIPTCQYAVPENFSMLVDPTLNPDANFMEFSPQ
ncbi:hypothetical protein HZS_3246 [Henneguya salminicola]|nr:hypothetical protein HZS_3246 [Henneguya salminicola]